MQRRWRQPLVTSVLSEREFERICIIKPSSLGDIIHALPVLSGLRRRYPQARISWILNTEYADLLQEHPHVDEVIPFDRQRFKTLWGAVHMTFRLQGFAGLLRSREFDLVIDLQGLFRSGLMTLATGSEVRLGFKPAREGAGMFYNHKIDVPDPTIHAVDKNYHVARILGFDHLPIDFVLPVNRAPRIAVRELLAEVGIREGQPFVVVLPGSRWETKNWWPERFARVIDRLQDRHGIAVVLSGSRAEQDLCQLIAQSCQSVPIDLSGQTTLAGLVALIEASSAVLCNDSASLHIAAALKKPLVSVFGPTSPQRTGPYGDTGTVLQADLACSPCFLRKLRQCPNGHECMNRISADHVYRALAPMLGSERGPVT